jgi:DNA-binding NarL/FixJ family response regulator
LAGICGGSPESDTPKGRERIDSRPPATAGREVRRAWPLVVVSDYPLLRSSVRDAVEGSEFAVVAEARTEPGVARALTAHPDAVLLVANRDPKRVLELVRDRFPDVTPIVLDDAATAESARAAFEHGARGFLASTLEPDQLVPALREIMAGASFRVVGIGLADVGLDTNDLTQRERQLLAAVAEGLTNGTIAQRFDVAEPTVKLHLTRIYRKLGVRNRTEAARWVFERGREAGVAE